MKRFDFAGEVAKQLITVSSAIITVIFAFYEKFFSKDIFIFFLVLGDLFLFIVSIATGILSLGGLVYLVERQENKEARSTFQSKIRSPSPSRYFISLWDTSAFLYARRQQIFFGLGLLCFIGIAAYDRLHNQSSVSIPTPPSTTPQIIFLPTPNVESGAGLPPIIWTSFGVAVIALVVGGTLLIYGRGSIAKGVGAVAIAGSLAMHGYLVNRIDIGSLINIKPTIDKIDIKSEIEIELKKLGSLGPTHEKVFTGFDLGSSDLKEDMQAGISDVCSKWRKQRENKQDGLLLVIGATDRVRLNPSAQLRYESNFGLARARAEAVKSKLVECGVQTDQAIILVSGPRNTPKVVEPPTSGKDFPEDRAVDIWALWNWRESSK